MEREREGGTGEDWEIEKEEKKKESGGEEREA